MKNLTTFQKLVGKSDDLDWWIPGIKKSSSIK